MSISPKWQATEYTMKFAFNLTTEYDNWLDINGRRFWPTLYIETLNNQVSEGLDSLYILGGKTKMLDI